MSQFSKVTFEEVLEPSEERGAIMVIFAVLVLCVVTLTGLAIDTGNLYSAKIGVQAAADAAALAAASLNALGRPQSEVMNGARQVGLMNLQIKGISYPPGYVPDVGYDPGDGVKIEVGIRVPVDLFILSKLPTVGGEAFKNVAASAVAEVRPAVVSLMLDVSESMGCPAVSAPDEPACSCAPNCDQSDPNSRMSALKLAILGDSQDPRNPGFLSFFDEQRDAIGLVLFGTGARTVVPMKPRDEGGGFLYSEIATAIRNAEAQGATNHSDALYQAYFDTKDAKYLDDASFLLFSDGAPTAARFLFKRGSTPNRSVREYETRVTPPALEGTDIGPLAQYDYLSWGVVKDGVSLPNETYFYPPYKNRGNNGYWEPLKLAETSPRRPPAWTVDQSIPRSSTGTTRRGIGSRPGRTVTGPQYDPAEHLNTAAPWTALSKVAPEGMEVVLPDQSFKKLGFEARWSGGNYLWADWSPGEHLKLYADMALAITDVIREQGNIFYGIGYGQPAPGSFDPYQNAEDPSTRKDYFMNRVTVDPCSLAEFNPPFPGVKTLPELAAGGVSTGSYYPAATPEQIQDVFMRIARKIKMRMVQ